MSKTALFVIDIQNRLADDRTTEIPHAARVREAGGEILQRARSRIAQSRQRGEEAGWLLVFVQHEDDTDADDDEPLIRDTHAWKLVFQPQGEDDLERLVSKSTRDTFESNASLAGQLREEGITKIVVFGVQSEYCVESTCKGALTAGFDVTLLQGAHSTHDTEERSARVIENDVDEELGRLGVKLLPWEQWYPTVP